MAIQDILPVIYSLTSLLAFYFILMKLHVYNSEKFNRQNLRYVIFGIVTAGSLATSIFLKNREGSVLLFFLLGGYFYYSVKNSGPVTMQIIEWWVQVGLKIFSRNSLLWFVLEEHIKTKEIRNIVLVTTTSHSIHTISDSHEALEAFVDELSKHKDRLGDYHQGTREKILRKLKI